MRIGNSSDSFSLFPRRMRRKTKNRFGPILEEMNSVQDHYKMVLQNLIKIRQK